MIRIDTPQLPWVGGLVEANSEAIKMAKIYLLEGWTDDEWDTDVQEEIEYLEEDIRKVEKGEIEEECLEDFYEEKIALKGFRELSKLPIPTLIVALEDLYEDDFKVIEEEMK